MHTLKTFCGLPRTQNSKSIHFQGPTRFTTKSTTVYKGESLRALSTFNTRANVTLKTMPKLQITKRLSDLTSKFPFASPLQNHQYFPLVGWNRRYSTAATSSAAPPPDVPSPEALNKLLEDALQNPSDADKQATYLKALNKLDAKAVIASFKDPKFAVNENAIKEYLKALVKEGQIDTAQLKSLLPGVVPGASKDNPFYVTARQEESGGWMLLRSLGSFILFAVVIYLIFFRGGTINDLFQTNYSPAETNVKVRLNDVKGSEEAKEELRDIVEYLKNPFKFQRMNAKLPKGVLLTGPPGCGKTLMAKALAGEAGVPFFYVSGSEFEEMLVGVGAKRVRALFKQAKAMAPCIIFMDEIDAIGASRDNPDSKTKMTLNQLLVELDGFEENKGIIVLAATNLPKVLDPALTRPGRFDRQVPITLPDLKARRDILDLYLADRGTDAVNLDFLAESTAGFSGADLFNMVNTAAIEAIKKNLSKITMHALENARENVMLGPERKGLSITTDTKKNIAYHEAGHALVALHCPSTDRQIIRATLVPRGNALGMVRYMLKNELLVTKETLETQLLVAMGGRAAEELIFGESKVTQGASNDFEQATKLAYEMISQYGMNKTIGHVGYSGDKVTEQTRFLMENETRALVEDSYNKTKKVLTTYKHELEQLAQALMQYDTLTLSEIEAVVAGKDIKELKEQKRKEEEDLRIKEEELLRLPDLPSLTEELPPPAKLQTASSQ